jgi:hypothetical protein
MNADSIERRDDDGGGGGGAAAMMRWVHPFARTRPPSAPFRDLRPRTPSAPPSAGTAAASMMTKLARLPSIDDAVIYDEYRPSPIEWGIYCMTSLSS